MNNHLTGQINSGFCNIENFDIRNNSLCGPFPDCVNSNFIFPQNNYLECDEFCNEEQEVNLYS